MNDLREAPIGVFDSGIGGLTVAPGDYASDSGGADRVLRRYGAGSLME